MLRCQPRKLHTLPYCWVSFTLFKLSLCFSSSCTLPHKSLCLCYTSFSTTSYLSLRCPGSFFVGGIEITSSPTRATWLLGKYLHTNQCTIKQMCCLRWKSFQLQNRVEILLGARWLGFGKDPVSALSTCFCHRTGSCNLSQSYVTNIWFCCRKYGWKPSNGFTAHTAAMPPRLDKISS